MMYNTWIYIPPYREKTPEVCVIVCDCASIIVHVIISLQENGCIENGFKVITDD